MPKRRKHHLVEAVLLVHQPLGDLDSDVCLAARKLGQLRDDEFVAFGS